MSAPQRRKGKPNRGGGRFNRSRGSSGGGGHGHGKGGGHGRGGGHGTGGSGGPRGRGRGRGSHGGGGGGFCGGRKGADSAAAMGYLGDSVVVGRDEYNDYDNKPRFVTTHRLIISGNYFFMQPL